MPCAPAISRSMSFQISLISHQLITESPSESGGGDIMDLWPDTSGHYVCLIAALVIGLWHMYFNKMAPYTPDDKFLVRLKGGMFMLLLSYVGLAIFYILGHDILYHWGGDYTD